MSTTYNNIVTFIILTGTLLAHPRIHASDQTPPATASCIAYCNKIACWQKSPCLAAHEQTEISSPTKLAGTSPKACHVSLRPDPKDMMQRRLSNPCCWAPFLTSPR